MKPYCTCVVSLQNHGLEGKQELEYMKGDTWSIRNFFHLLSIPSGITSSLHVYRKIILGSFIVRFGLPND